MCIGDFNEIAMEREKQGGRLKQARKMEAFNEMMRSAGLVDLGYNGQHFIWCNNREGDDRIKERLDREIVNADWIRVYAKSEVTHKLNIGSYHCPILVQMERKGNRSKRPFRFDKMWLEKQECRAIIREVWEVNGADRNQTGMHDRLGDDRQVTSSTEGDTTKTER